jgi:transposase
MPKPCSLDLRMRLLEAVIAGATRREAADCFDVSASSAVKWLQRWQETGSVAAKLTGGSISPLEEHADWLLALIAKQSDLTLDEVVAAMRKPRIAGSRSAVWRFFKRHNISSKKACGPRSKCERMWPAHGGAECENRACCKVKISCRKLSEVSDSQLKSRPLKRRQTTPPDRPVTQNPA